MQINSYQNTASIKKKKKRFHLNAFIHRQQRSFLYLPLGVGIQGTTNRNYKQA